MSDVEVIDDYPSHFSSYNRRKHRWVRGDWQILRWLRSRVPDFSGQIVANPISLLSQWKILDNLRRSLFEPSLLLLFLGSWLYLPQSPVYWTAAAVAVLFLPAWSRLLFAIIRSLARVFVTRRRLLEWETAAEAESGARGKATVDFYLEWTPWIASAIGMRCGPFAQPLSRPPRRFFSFG